MLKSKGFWYLLMAGAICGWIFTFTGLVKPFKNKTLKKIWQSVALTWLLGHPLELLVARGVGSSAGIATTRTVIKTLIYGITWWIPVKLGVFKD